MGEPTAPGSAGGTEAHPEAAEGAESLAALAALEEGVAQGLLRRQPLRRLQP